MSLAGMAFSAAFMREVLLFKKWFGAFSSPSLDWIQVEVTSCCNATCSYCPRTVYREAWLNRNLSLEAFERLTPAFTRAKMVFLQGWGEPFLNSDLMTMARIAKKAGCKVGTTTNGMLLNEKIIYQLIECGMDVLAFSLAGIDEKNDALRQGTRLDTILGAIHLLQEIKKNWGKELPAVHIAYILLRSRLGDIEGLPFFLQGLAVSQVVVSTLDFVPCKELEGETIKPSTAEEYEELRARLDAVKVETEQLGVRFHYRLHGAGEGTTTCTENIQRALFVSSDGRVSPCVFTNLPISQDTQICFNGDQRYRRLTFGNVGDASIGDIWRGRAYRDFRESFYGMRLPSICQDCPKLFVG
jgi:MoaA/NifB/PqqE/SkfB family radical SAM enzyme